MELMLQKDYPSLGYVGDKIVVKRGFARNYLIPRGIAVEMNSRNARQLKHQMAIIEAKKVAARKEAEDKAEAVKSVNLEFKLKIGQGGKSFGSVTSRDIAMALTKEGHDTHKRQVKLHEPLRSAGAHEIEISLHTEVSVPVTVNIIAEAAPKAKPKKEAKAKATESGEEELEAEAFAEEEEQFEAESAETVEEEPTEKPESEDSQE
jgi:large subunit ribosomal protein L9